MTGRPAGFFVAVVGPSGVGKDSLIGHARRILAGDPRFVFVRRLVTRPADAALEAHDSLSWAQYEAGLRDGRFALAWRAHGLGYALPATLRDELAAGHVVCANISRRAVDEARAAFSRCRVVAVTAPREVVAARMAARGREDAAQIAARLNRECTKLAGDDVIEIDNSGELADAGARLVRTLRAACEADSEPGETSST